MHYAALVRFDPDARGIYADHAAIVVRKRIHLHNIALRVPAFRSACSGMGRNAYLADGFAFWCPQVPDLPVTMWTQLGYRLGSPDPRCLSCA